MRERHRDGSASLIAVLGIGIGTSVGKVEDDPRAVLVVHCAWRGS